MIKLFCGCLAFHSKISASRGDVWFYEIKQSDPGDRIGDFVLGRSVQNRSRRGAFSERKRICRGGVHAES